MNKIECPNCGNKKSPSHFKGRTLCSVCWIRYKKSDEYPKPLPAIEAEVIEVRVETGKSQVPTGSLRNRGLSQADAHIVIYNRRIARCREYGITLSQYNSMYERQNGCCAICGSAPLPGESMFIDHCHATGMVRGLLCRLCNTGLGHFKDDPERLRKGIEYLGSKLILS